MIRVVQIFILLGLVWSMGCTEEPDCQDTRAPFARIEYFNLENAQRVEVFIDSLWAEGAIVPFTTNDTTATSDLMLNPEDTQSTYYFLIDNEIDTLTLGYASKLEVKSALCGPFQSFFDITVLNTSFDSVVVVFPIADSRLWPNVEIYR